MRKRDRIIYWISTGWLALGMVSTGIVQLMRTDDELSRMAALGYSGYVLTMIGAWKMVGVVAVLVPGFPLLKEWAYAGFFFIMSGAIFSHIARADAASELFGPALLLVLTIVSWRFRPADRRLVPSNP